MSELKPNQYRCNMCGGVFEKTVSDEEALAEAKETFGAEYEPEEGDTVCDDCWNKFMDQFN